MKAYAFAELGERDSFQLVELPEPAPERGEVTIEVETVAANRLDLVVLKGFAPGASPTSPFIPGIDPAGVVTSVGAGITDVSVGDRVVAKPNVPCLKCVTCLNGQPWACTKQRIIGVHMPGGFATRVAIPGTNAVPIPPGLSNATATAAIHSAPVALRLIKQAGDIAPGMKVAVIGGAGAVGSAAVQIAHLRGAVVTSVVGGQKKAEFVESLGAKPIDHRQTRDIEKALLDATNGTGPDLVFDTAGSPDSAQQALAALGWQGVYAVCGTHGGGSLEVDLGRLYRKRQKIVGSSSSGFDDVREILSEIARGAIDVRIHSVLDVSEAPVAYSVLESRENLGKIVLRHGGDA